ncbi:MAG: IS21 family transposase [Deltaproteobacteria bacterium]|nr:IS21 family transposase [Deltaproteobacteria bacterium]
MRTDFETRTAVLRLHRQGHGLKTIARTLGISKNTVKRLVFETDAPAARACALDPYAERVRELYLECKGNRVRVHEELAKAGISVPYPTLTRFVRRLGLGVRVPERSGQYDFAPGAEMQHDTSPHTVEIAGKPRALQCASLVLCYSRMLYAEVFPTFHRFYAKVFLTEALQAFGGAAKTCMLDNSSIIIGHGTGKNAVPAPEMEAFSARFGFTFAAHELGDANRSGRVERPFHFIENNFYAGRRFANLADLNEQLRAWCEQQNRSVKRHLQASPLELFAAERPHLRALPLYVPEPYARHHRTVDLEGNVHLHTNAYSVPDELIGRSVEVHETKTAVRVFHQHHLVCEHVREEEGARVRKILPAHQHKGRTPRSTSRPPIPEEALLRAAGEEFAELVGRLRKLHAGRAVRPLRRLHQLYLDYPTESLRACLREALAYGLTDLDRIERMLLRALSGDFFRLPSTDERPHTPPDPGNERDDDDR